MLLPGQREGAEKTLDVPELQLQGVFAEQGLGDKDRALCVAEGECHFFVDQVQVLQRIAFSPGIADHAADVAALRLEFQGQFFLGTGLVRFGADAFPDAPEKLPLRLLGVVVMLGEALSKDLFRDPYLLKKIIPGTFMPG